MKGVVGKIHDGDAIWDIREVIRWTGENFPKMAYTPAEIVAASARFPEWEGRFDLGGIYFLQQRGKICYIGKAVSLCQRIMQHRRQNRPFDAVTVIAGVPNEAVGSLEFAYESAWEPPWNRARTCGGIAGTAELKAALKAMPRDLIGEEPELPPLTPREMDSIIAKLDAIGF